MKRWILAGLLIASCASAQTVSYAVSANLAWDAVTTKGAGLPLATGDVMSYELARLPMPIVSRVNPPVVAVAAGVTVNVTVPADSKSYSYAVRSKLVTDGGATTLYSAWIWSDQAGTPSPFVLRQPSTDSPGPPGNFRLGA